MTDEQIQTLAEKLTSVMTPKLVYSEREAAQILQVSHRTLEEYRKAGIIGYVQYPSSGRSGQGRMFRYTREHLEKFCASCEKKFSHKESNLS